MKRKLNHAKKYRSMYVQKKMMKASELEILSALAVLKSDLIALGTLIKTKNFTLGTYKNDIIAKCIELNRFKVIQLLIDNELIDEDDNVTLFALRAMRHHDLLILKLLSTYEKIKDAIDWDLVVNSAAIWNEPFVLSFILKNTDANPNVLNNNNNQSNWIRLIDDSLYSSVKVLISDSRINLLDKLVSGGGNIIDYVIHTGSIEIFKLIISDPRYEMYK